jgi:cupin fold WbuC family metalloprotein
MDEPAGIALRKVNDEVFVAEARVVRAGAQQVAFLKRQAAANARRRARICAHRTNEDRLHEMLIAISSDSYIHPHKHLRKSESFHIVEGTVDIVMFDDAGAVTDVIELGDVASGRNFYYRLSDSVFHTLVIHGDFLVMHEVTNGPFVREETVLAPFAPGEERRDAALAYMAGVARAAAAWRAKRGKESQTS